MLAFMSMRMWRMLTRMDSLRTSLHMGGPTSQWERSSSVSSQVCMFCSLLNMVGMTLVNLLSTLRRSLGWRERDQVEGTGPSVLIL